MRLLGPDKDDYRMHQDLLRSRSWAAFMSVAAGTHDVSFRPHTRRSAHPCTAPPEAHGAANPRLGVVCGTKAVGKSHARAPRRCLPAARRLDLNVPVGAKCGADEMVCLLVNFGLKPFLGGVLGQCGWAEKKSSEGHISRKNDPVSTFGNHLP